jgi:hypothetical protein
MGDEKKHPAVLQNATSYAYEALSTRRSLIFNLVPEITLQIWGTTGILSQSWLLGGQHRRLS